MSAPLSQSLPDTFDQRPIGLIAGKGRYPVLMAERIRAAGLPLRVVSFDGETEQALIDSIPKDAHLQIKVGQLGKLLKSLEKLGCGYALMAGQITTTPVSWTAPRHQGTQNPQQPEDQKCRDYFRRNFQ